ncbi:LOW QUALITY PROTEIN: acetyltransferase, partial [Streptomyces sp. C]
MNDLHIGPASAPDLPAVLDFWKDAAKGASISDDLAGVERLHARDPEALLLARRDGELVGTVIAGFDGWRCHLYPARRAPGPPPAGHRAPHCWRPPRSGSPRWAAGAPTRWCSTGTSRRTGRGGRPATAPRTSGPAGSSRSRA